MSGPARPNAPPVVVPNSGNNIILNPLQRGNPILEHVRNVGKEFGDIVADYQVGRTTGVLFLSLKYHRLHPEYIHTRIQKLGHSYNLRILLVLCDITEHKDAIRELTKICLINNITIIVAFSSEEAGHYLTVFKQFEYKPPTLIKERVDKDYTSMLRSSLTSISKVNKTDVETLRNSFGSIANMSKATPEQLGNLPGFGQVKVKNIKNAFEKPFRNQVTNTLASRSTSQPSKDGQEKDDGKKQAAGREPSPVWDIEIEDTEPLPSTDGQKKDSGSGQSGGIREPSPIWDIEPEDP
ncbi:hypothetical protein D9758_002814 [Tetrapyrgos nigripes]|uniref:ERCC1-like central domain-containing protein n=1 Tax=Tetrapyrgos nigripes TaxID=182062 RepID=A0A8H5GQS9_9AGAR|nr:hypothetical protein D9758_002814 [Tetrapyrgos nigripes]